MRSTPTRLAVLFALAAGAACGGGGGGKEAPPAIYSISGTVTGSVIDGILMTLGGDGLGTTGTDPNGVFTFQNLPPGTYSVTPYADNTTFDPANRICVIESESVTGMDFTSTGTGPDQEDATPPASPVRLVFVANSCGQRWLDDADGGLGSALGSNNYYVRDVTLGWDAPQNQDIGSRTDIGHWYTWFVDTTLQLNNVPVRDNITGALYTTNDQNGAYAPIADPGGTNEVILIESCFLNSAVKNDNGQPPAALYGMPASSAAHTLPNCQEVYRQILTFFKTQPTRLFVVLTAPPMRSADTLLTDAANARTLNDWLVDGWLQEGGWERKNVVVFDLFNVITDPDNHHRVVAGAIQHINTNGDNFSAYATVDSHPNQSGNQKATSELVPLLNAGYNRWQSWLNP